MKGITYAQMVRDVNVLKGMATADKLVYPVDKGHYYVDEENRSRSFEYKGSNYRIEYLDGCFYPFVFKVEN